MSIADYLLPSLATWICDGFLKDGWVTNQVYTNMDDCLYVDNEVICFYVNNELTKYNLIDNSQASFFVYKNGDSFEELCGSAWLYKKFLYSVKFPFLIGFLCGYKNKIILVNVLTLSIIHEWRYEDNDDLMDPFDEYLFKKEDLFPWYETENELIIKTDRGPMFKAEITYRQLSFGDTKLQNKNFVKSWSLETTFSLEYYYFTHMFSIADNIFHIRRIGDKNEGHHYLDTIRPICRHIFKTDYVIDSRYAYIRRTNDVNGYCVVYLNDGLVCIIQRQPLSFYKYKSCTCKIIIE